MEKMTSMLLMLVMVGAFIAASQAITCYECDTDGCGDPFTPSSSFPTCTGEVCFKAKIDGDGGKVARECFSRSEVKMSLGCHSESEEGTTGTVCLCDTNLCNGATMTSSFGHVITAVALLISVIIGYLL